MTHDLSSRWLESLEKSNVYSTLLIDEAGIVLDINSSSLELLEMTKDQLLGKPINILMTSENSARHDKWLTELFGKNAGFIQQLPHPVPVYTPNGLHLTLNIVIIKLSGTTPARALVIFAMPEAGMTFFEKLITHESRFRSILEQSPIPMALNDEHQNVTYLNPAFTRVFGYTLSDIPHLSDWWPKAYPQKDYRDWANDTWAKHLAHSTNTNQPFEAVELNIHTKFDTDVIVLATAAALETGYKNEHLVTLQNITDIRNAEGNLQFQSEVLQHLQEGIHLISIETQSLVYTNERMCTMFGYDPGEMVGLPVDQLNAGTQEEQMSIAKEIVASLAERGTWEGDVKNKRRDGTEFWCHASVETTLHPEYGHCWVSIHQDITERKQFHQQLWRQANYDPLTNLPNRRLFQENLELEVAKCERDNESFALLFLDIDDFKDINDIFGHPTGDAILVEVAARLEQSIRNSDLVGRFAGDEFVLLIRDVSPDHPADLQWLAEKISSAIAAPFYVQPETVSVTVSIGIAIFPLDGRNINVLLSRSDQALYASKSEGKNQIKFFTSELQTRAQRNRRLLSGLQNALKAKEFSVYYQPIIDAKTRKCVKAEALLRWTTDGQAISPIEFIPLAEESGLIHDIGQFVFEQVITDAIKLKSKGFSSIKLNLNKSMLQMQKNSIATEKLWPLLVKNANLESSNICIELTESSVLTDSDAIAQKFQKLHKAGFEFAIDDFGTGYTSFSHITRFPFQTVKIDRSFITNMASSQRNQDIIEGMIALSHKMKMEVVAEGIETQDQFDLLRSFDCDFIQGFLIAKPMPYSAFIDWLQDDQNTPNVV